jgi:hypothetical protein
MHNDAVDEVRLNEAGMHPCAVGSVGRLFAGEVEHPRLGRKARERLEELEDPLSRQPVRDREERRSSPVTEVQHGSFGSGRDVPSRGDDSYPRARDPVMDELLREMVARRDQDGRSSERESIERRLGPRTNAAVVDAARRLVEDPNHRHAEPASRKRRACERSGDRIEQDGARAELLQPTKQCRATKRSERERPFGKGLEDDSRPMRRRCIRHPEVIQIPAAQAARIP